MTLRNLSDKEIKTINGGFYTFPITTFLVGGILDTALNLKNLVTNTVNGVLSVLSIPI